MTTQHMITFIDSKRVDKGLSKQELCDKADVKVNTYWRYLKGLEPPFCTVIRLLKAVEHDINVVQNTNKGTFIYDL